MSWMRVTLGLSRGILRDRGLRRRFIANLLFVTLGWLAVGLWVIDGWLGQGVWRFVVWWAFCGVLAVVAVLFTIYDALAVVGEERERMKKALLEDEDE